MPSILPSESIKSELDELAWWIERGIMQTRRYFGLCTRTLFIENPAESVELKYYQIGKIFRFQNILSATAMG